MRTSDLSRRTVGIILSYGCSRTPLEIARRLRSSRPHARSIVPTPARFTSPFSADASSRSTGRKRIRSPAATSAPRSGSSASASTGRIACCIRRFASGAKGQGHFKRVSWDEALELVVDRFRRAKARTWGGDRSCPYSYGGSNGLADPGQPRRAAVAALRHVAAGADDLRRTDRRGQPGAVRQDAVGHLPGLSVRRADRLVGRQPLGVRHSPRALRARGPETRRHARRRRSADDDAGAAGGHPSRDQAGHGRGRRARPASASLRKRTQRRGVSPRAHDGRGAAARTRGAVDHRARRRDRGHRRRAACGASRSCTRRARRR